MNQIVWFRQDLRVADNPALAHAAALGHVVPVYIFDETQPPAGRPLGGAACWWVHHSVLELRKSLGGLIVLRGDPLLLLPQLSHQLGAVGVFWNRCYEPFAIARDRKLKAALRADGLDVASFNASLLFEPWQVCTQPGEPFKIFSAFWRACQRSPVEAPAPAPTVTLAPVVHSRDDPRLSLLPPVPCWSNEFSALWQPGERSAVKQLDRFIEHGLTGYRAHRDRPDLGHVSISNRARLVAASFLVKHLRIHWRDGEHWFWDTLLDADLANNAASWQWVAGSGADAAPYFRIFNPVEQGRKFDPAGSYVRRWCPELARLPDNQIHAPFEADSHSLAQAGVRLGHTYPLPIVDHVQARLAALAGFDIIKKQAMRATTL